MSVEGVVGVAAEVGVGVGVGVVGVVPALPKDTRGCRNTHEEGRKNVTLVPPR